MGQHASSAKKGMVVSSEQRTMLRRVPASNRIETKMRPRTSIVRAVRNAVDGKRKNINPRCTTKEGERPDLPSVLKGRAVR